MAERLRITSAQNPRLKQAAALQDRRDRDRSGQFLIEGYRALRRAVDSGYPVSELFICPELFQGENEPALIADCEAAGAQVVELPATLFGKLAYRERPEGLAGVAPQRHRPLSELEPGSNPLLLVAVAIEKPGNLGTMLRSADATGVTGLILCD
ncbi:MAG: RNA methyltransferase, partial [Lentisphaeria bacterium]